jgi:hypothetical protein
LDKEAAVFMELLVLFNINGELLKIASGEYLGPGFDSSLLSRTAKISLQSLFHHEDYPSVFQMFLELVAVAQRNLSDSKCVAARMVTDFGR